MRRTGGHDSHLHRGVSRRSLVRRFSPPGGCRGGQGVIPAVVKNTLHRAAGPRGSRQADAARRRHPAPAWRRRAGLPAAAAIAAAGGPRLAEARRGAGKEKQIDVPQLALGRPCGALAQDGSVVRESSRVRGPLRVHLEGPARRAQGMQAHRRGRVGADGRVRHSPGPAEGHGHGPVRQNGGRRGVGPREGGDEGPQIFPPDHHGREADSHCRRSRLKHVEFLDGDVRNLPDQVSPGGVARHQGTMDQANDAQLAEPSGPGPAGHAPNRLGAGGQGHIRHEDIAAGYAGYPRRPRGGVDAPVADFWPHDESGHKQEGGHHLIPELELDGRGPASARDGGFHVHLAALARAAGAVGPRGFARPDRG
mmetsp:Transcript_62446/g.190963  ORF Transcript_62446/g.190963 Transcript_62446/m.190963 type:complete len:365 (+) Transcript_62446:486-1580(+)